MNIFEKLFLAVFITIFGFYLLDKYDDKIQEKIDKQQELSFLDKFLVNFVNKFINLIVRTFPLIIIAIIITLYLEYSVYLKNLFKQIGEKPEVVENVKSTINDVSSKLTGGSSYTEKIQELSKKINENILELSKLN